MSLLGVASELSIRMGNETLFPAWRRVSTQYGLQLGILESYTVAKNEKVINACAKAPTILGTTTKLTAELLKNRVLPHLKCFKLTVVSTTGLTTSGFLDWISVEFREVSILTMFGCDLMIIWSLELKQIQIQIQ